MIPLPIQYHKVHVGFVFLDTPIYDQVVDLPWHLELPPGIRRWGHSVDVILGLLREDEVLLNKCVVYMMLNSTRGFKVRLAKCVLHPGVIPLLHEHQLRASLINNRKELLFHEIRNRLMRIPRVIHIDKNHLNCQSTNLRELSYEPLEEPSGLYHEE
jgi:hypothetical protein